MKKYTVLFATTELKKEISKNQINLITKAIHKINKKIVLTIDKNNKLPSQIDLVTVTSKKVAVAYKNTINNICSGCAFINPIKVDDKLKYKIKLFALGTEKVSAIKTIQKYTKLDLCSLVRQTRSLPAHIYVKTELRKEQLKKELKDLGCVVS